MINFRIFVLGSTTFSAELFEDMYGSSKSNIYNFFGTRMYTGLANNLRGGGSESATAIIAGLYEDKNHLKSI